MLEMVSKKNKNKNKKLDMSMFSRKISTKEISDLLIILEKRFKMNMYRHENLSWGEVKEKIIKNKDLLKSIHYMEITGGEPDIMIFKNYENYSGYYDCSSESPIGRRGLCYDLKSQLIREKNGVFPLGNVIDMVNMMGVELLDDKRYNLIQSIEDFDTKTSSWIKTPDDVFNLGGAIFGDKRYGRVFFYHNGAGAFYSARGFRSYINI